MTREIERMTPDALAMAREEGWDHTQHQVMNLRCDTAAIHEARDERCFAIEREVFSRLSAHWFSAGPQPEEVVQRVFAAALDRRADLLGGLSRAEIAMATEETARGRRWRLQQLFRGVGANWRERYRTIVGTLSVAFAGANRPEILAVTLNEALAVGRCGGEPPEATETLSRVLEKLFACGSGPRQVAQQTFALSGWLFRDHQLNMSFEELGKLFGETRAAQSWRSIERVQGMLQAAGFRGFKASWQKTETAVAAYRVAAQGNHNRSQAAPRRSFPPALTQTHSS